jgi:uncharacterized protein YpmS
MGAITSLQKLENRALRSDPKWKNHNLILLALLIVHTILFLGALIVQYSPQLGISIHF